MSVLQELDLTGHQFKWFDFREGVVAFNPHTVFHETVALNVWGAILNQWACEKLVGDGILTLPGGFDHSVPCALYLSGWGKLIFSCVSSLSLHLAPFAPTLEDENKQFLMIQGEQVSLDREWVQEDVNVTGSTDSSEHVYGMNVYLEQPAGDLDLGISAYGKATFRLNLEHFVPIDLYRNQRNQFGFDWYRERVFQSSSPQE